MTDIAVLTKGQKRRLSRYICTLCEVRLDRDWCSAIYEQCTSEDREKRRQSCLAGYRPRGGRPRGGRHD